MERESNEDIHIQPEVQMDGQGGERGEPAGHVPGIHTVQYRRRGKRQSYRI